MALADILAHSDRSQIDVPQIDRILRSLDGIDCESKNQSEVNFAWIYSYRNHSVEIRSFDGEFICLEGNQSVQMMLVWEIARKYSQKLIYTNEDETLELSLSPCPETPRALKLAVQNKWGESIAAKKVAFADFKHALLTVIDGPCSLKWGDYGDDPNLIWFGSEEPPLWLKSCTEKGRGGSELSHSEFVSQSRYNDAHVKFSALLDLPNLVREVRCDRDKIDLDGLPTGDVTILTFIREATEPL